MTTDRIETFAAFVRVFETESFSEVARELGVTQPTVSRLIASLEERLGAQLFSRSTRRLSPTTDALKIYGKVRDLLDTVAEIEADARGRSSEPNGLLQVSMPSSFATAKIIPRLLFFLDKFPRVTLNLRLHDHSPDIIGEGSELAIQIGELASSSLVGRRIGIAETQLVASTSYLQRNGRLNAPEDLMDHDCIVYASGPDARRWTFESDLGRRVVDVGGRLSLNGVDAVAQSVRAGLGIAMLPTWLLEDQIRSGEVKRLLTDFHSGILPISVVYAPTRWLSNRARCFMEFAIECL